MSPAASRFTLLEGSPKVARSTSGSLGGYILSKVGGKGSISETHHVGKALNKEEKWNDLVRSLDEADVIILTFPLYWDGLPSHLVRGLERSYERGVKDPSRKRFYVIVHNGFPEPWHNEVAVRICEQFCDQMNFQWRGALNIGGGAVVGGRPLEETGGMTLKLRQTLDLAAEAITRGDPIPEDVLKRLEKPLYPPWFAVWFGGYGWRRLAKRKGAVVPIKARPYERRD